MSTRPGPGPAGQASFPPTSWTLIRKVQKGSEADAARAMEEICRQYWYPLYAFARRSGFSMHDAEDLTQGLFQSLISLDSMRAVSAEGGSMRTFMLQALKHTISKKLRHDTAVKRGGSASVTLSFDDLNAEERYAAEPANARDADALFDRAWANDMLASAEAKLRDDYAKAGTLATFEALREFLPLGDNATPYAAAAKHLGIGESTLRLQIHRMRKRYGRLVEKVIAQTVDHPEEVRAELAHLMAAVGR